MKETKLEQTCDIEKEEHPPLVWTALICCRVSDKSQLKGSGLESQEHRGRQYADINGYPVERVFHAAKSGGLSLMQRPEIQELLAHIDANAHSEKRYVVIFDDHKRFAREAEYHLQLRRILGERGVRVEFLNFKPEETPEGKFMELICAGQAQLEREQNARQSYQKTKARLEKGFWTRRAPIGYRYVQSKQGGKNLVQDEPISSIVKEALEGYASGRFATQTEMKRFLESDPRYPKDLPSGELRPQTVVRLMSQILYAGYLEAPSWGVSLRKAQHEPIISLETFEKIQQRRNENAYAPTRKDIHKDFVLRGAVCCSSCNSPLTAGWSKGKYKKYPYYFCKKKGCTNYGKTIARAKLEGEFEKLLKELQPTNSLSQIVTAMFKDAWNIQRESTAAIAKTFKQDAKKIEKDINRLIERIMDTNNPRVIQAYETRIDELEKKKLLCQEKEGKIDIQRHSFEEMFELSMKMLSNPCKIWASNKFNLQRTMLKLVFSDLLQYDRNKGFRTPKTTLPFKVLSDFFCHQKGMVPLERETLNSLLEELIDWEAQLKPLHSQIHKELEDRNIENPSQATIPTGYNPL